MIAISVAEERKQKESSASAEYLGLVLTSPRAPSGAKERFDLPPFGIS